MFGRVRQWVIFWAALTGLAGGVLAATGIGSDPTRIASRGYLPSVGPVPLRIRVPETPSTNLVHMPLPPVEPEPVITATPSEQIAAAKPAPPPRPAAPSPNTNAPVQTEPLGTPPTADPLISPQMLLKYFSHTTNGPASGVVAPMDFTPPASARPVSGSATYSTGPN